MDKIVIGIDPGKLGGIAVLDMSGNVELCMKMPDTPMEILMALDEIRSNYDPVCYMEDVGHGMPGQSSSATAKFARHCGQLDGFLMSLRIKTVTVTPQKWQKTYQLGKSCEHTKTEWKGRLKSKAQQLFPGIAKKITLATSDALLIAEYGRQKEK